MPKQELLERLRALAETQFFDRGLLNEGLQAYRATGEEPPPRLYISCGCALWREGRHFEAATSFAMAPLESVRDHLRACRVECLRGRQVAHAVAIARMEGVCIAEDLKAHASIWRKLGHVGESVAAYRAAGVPVPEHEFRNAGRVFQIMGSLAAALDAYEVAKTPPPAKDLQDWLSHRPALGGDPRLELRVIEALLRDSQA
ncbi:MAG: hypothetical protein ACRC33_05100 [Gemmataceae bacterium]